MSALPNDIGAFGGTMLREPYGHHTPREGARGQTSAGTLDLQSVLVIPLTSENGWTASAVRRVGLLTSMKDGWDGAGASRPNATAARAAFQAIQALDEFGLETVEIDPSVEEGICISFFSGKKYAHIECFNDGAVIAATSSETGAPTIWEIGLNGWSWQASAYRVSKFLKS